MVRLASSYPLLDVFWTMIVFFSWIIWIWLLVAVFADLFGRHDIGGWAKAGWTVMVLVLPFVGVLIYMISQSRSMAERKATETAAAQASFDTYVRSVASSNGQGGVGEIDKAKQLLDSGAITQTEYETLKRRALAS
jgi:putative oligomerization/nucleic acid binding protein